MIQFDEHIFQMGGSTTNHLQYPDRLMILMIHTKKLQLIYTTWKVDGATPMY